MTVPSPESESESQLIAFVLTVPSDEGELAADRLWQLGVRGVEERPHRPGADEPASAVRPRIELWTSLGDDPLTAIADLAWPQNWSWRTERVDAAPAHTWRDHSRPIDVSDRLLIVPAWQEIPSAVDHRLVLSIEPGGAFGLGDHPTTALSLAALLDAFDAFDARGGRQRPVNVLDVGCGTGLLAIAAARVGAGRVRAIDVSSAAIEATDDNSRRNGVEHIVTADRTPCSDVEGTFDVVVANILAPVLVALAVDLARSTAPGGRLIVSGLLATAHDHVLAALAPMVVERIDHRDGWVAITLCHAAGRPAGQRARSSSI